MPMSDRAARLAALLAVCAPTIPAAAQTISALPEQTSHIRLSNHDVNHLVCAGGEIEDVR